MEVNLIKKSAIISLIALFCFGLGYYVIAISPHQRAVQSFNEVTAKIQKENRSLEETIKVSKELLSSKDIVFYNKQKDILELT